jgi:predicted restriction endonuclease
LLVHHALPINLSEDLKLDESNLITLCSIHHSMCDKGQIPYAEVKKIINEQNQKQSNPPTTPTIFKENTQTPTAPINLHRI